MPPVIAYKGDGKREDSIDDWRSGDRMPKAVTLERSRYANCCCNSTIAIVTMVCLMSSTTFVQRQYNLSKTVKVSLLHSYLPVSFRTPRMQCI